MYGCFICFGCGVLVSILASLFLWTGHTTKFAIFYTFGNLIAMCSSLFLVGPKRQCQSMWKKERAAATIIYFSAMIATLIIAFVAKNPSAACLILIIIQFLAGTWYTLSYVPGARTAVKACFNSV
mmetsp:Transcript_19256/g.32142  ORF Transcript_19256/g.32142 Transcript_19256/m.32142 type:complete len:125 (+) Transcript_19256:1324-1698(+)